MLTSHIDLPAAVAEKPGPHYRRMVTLRAIGPTLASEIELVRAYNRILRGAALLVRKNVPAIFASAKQQLSADAMDAGFGQFEEHEHPRGPGGKWTEKAGGKSEKRRLRKARGDLPEKSPGSYTRERTGGTGGSGRGRPRALYRPDEDTVEQYNKAGVTPVSFGEFGKESAETFHEAIAAAKGSSKFGASVTLYDKADYEGMRLFMTMDRQMGFALKGDDIVSVFKHADASAKDATTSILDLAVQEGGRRLDAFDTVLPDLYAANGFRAVARLKFNDEFAPEGWNYDFYKGYNGGRPDVVFMVYDPENAGYNAGDGEEIEEYEQGAEEQRLALPRKEPWWQQRTPTREAPQQPKAVELTGPSSIENAETDGDGWSKEVIYHGTRGEIEEFNNSTEVYLTSDLQEAGAFAKGVHLGGSGKGPPKTYALKFKPGKTLDIQPKLDEAMEADDDLDEAISKEIARITVKEMNYHRTKRTAYLMFDHPGVSGKDFKAVISLYPGDDLKIVGKSNVGDQFVRDTVREVGQFTALFRNYIDKNLPQYNQLVNEVLANEEVRFRNQFTSAVSAAVGIDISPVLRSSDVRAQIEAATLSYAGLIKGISDDMAKSIGTMVLREAQKGTRASELAKMLSKQFGFTSKRAKLIARDQLASFNGSLNQIRQQQIGVDKYIWSTSLDERVRPLHVQREGNTYSWNKPPSDGHPGIPINCRCVARAVIGTGGLADSVRDAFEEQEHPRDPKGKFAEKPDVDHPLIEFDWGPAKERFQELLAGSGVTADEFVKGMLPQGVDGKLFISQTAAVSEGKSITAVTVQCNVPGFEMIRHLWPDKTVEHEKLKLDKQGLGTAKSLMRSQIALYQRLGFKQVELHANIKVGSYAWTKYGFLPYRDEWARWRRDLEKRLESREFRKGFESDVLRAIQKIVDNGSDPRSMWALADIRAKHKEHGTVGKALLIGTSFDRRDWSGSLDFNNKEAMERFNAYVGK